MIGTKLDIDALLKEALDVEDDRAKRILLHRFGLNSAEKKTLAKLGEDYGLTRERVRQIESSTLALIRERIKKHKEAIRFLELLEGYLADVGDVRRGDFVARDLAVALGRDESEDDLYNKLHFVASVLEWPHVSGGNEEWYIVWHRKPNHYDRVRDVARHLLDMDEHDFEHFLKSARTKFKLNEMQLVNHLAASKRFMVGPYGDMGADHWIHVNPKTVRDKIYLVLQKSDDPLHFTEIADLVNELSDRRRAPATVHNELIKDPRFALVSRGTYSLNV